MNAVSNISKPREKHARRTDWSPAIQLAAYIALSALLAGILLERVTRPLPGDDRDLATAAWTILVGVICNASCAILGCYLVLRRMSLLGDAISHAVLPGIALGYLFSGSVAGLPILLGAMALGVLTSVLTQGISSLGRVSEDTSLGVVFTSLFALGVILIQAVARHVDLDPDCVLYGAIDYAGVDLTPVFGAEVSRPLLMLASGPAHHVAPRRDFLERAENRRVRSRTGLGDGLSRFYHSLPAHGDGLRRDRGLVRFRRLNPRGCHARRARRHRRADDGPPCLDDGLGRGYWCDLRRFGLHHQRAARHERRRCHDGDRGAAIHRRHFLCPAGGTCQPWLRNQALAVRIAAEDILAGLYRAEERGSPRQGPETTAGFVGRLARWRLFRSGWVAREPSGVLQLTTTGRDTARSLVRAHRLWESYLDTHFDLPRDHLHDAAERMEHYLGAALQEELAAELADKAVDPHGKAIPPASAPASGP